MTIRHERLKELIRQIASEEILQFTSIIEHPFGIISLVEVDVAGDMSYADIFIQSQEDSQTLPKFLSPLAQKIHAKMGKEIGLRKTPKVRFRIKKEKRNSADILSLIHELDQKYGLSQENN